MSGDLYEENLWNKIEYLHERYHREHNHISNFLDMMTKYQNACLEFSKQITNILNKNYILSESNTSSLYKSMENFYKCLLMHSQAFKETFESIKINLAPVTKSIYDSFQKEKEMYNSYLKTRTVYNNSKAYLDKIKKEFNQKSKDCENLVYNAKKAKLFSTATPDQIIKLENKASESLANTTVFEDKYIQTLTEANKARENEINAQKKIQRYYHNIDSDYYGKIRMLTGFFVSCLKRMFNSILEEVEELNKSFNQINIENDIKEFVEKYKTNTKPDDIIKYIPFKPAPELVSNSIVNSNANEAKNLIISYEVILVFRKLFKYIRTDLDMEEERKKNKFRILTLKIFREDNNVSFTQNELNEILKFLQEKKYRSYFITILSKVRTKGYKKGEKLINDLADIFLYILEIAEKENELETALNCVILGHTFYYEKFNKYKNSMDKKYLIEGIKENKWLNTTEFWGAVIDLMIQRETVKNEEIKNNNEKEKKNAFNKIVYTQMFNYTNTMLEFNINTDDIYNLVEKLSQKYQLKKEDFESITKRINDANKKKEKLEEEIKNEIKENKNEDNEVNQKEEAKEEKEKEEIKEEKKEEEKEGEKEEEEEEDEDNEEEDEEKENEEEKKDEENKEEKKDEEKKDDENKEENKDENKIENNEN